MSHSENICQRKMKDTDEDKMYDPIQEIFHASIPQKQAGPPDKRNNIGD